MVHKFGTKGPSLLTRRGQLQGSAIMSMGCLCPGMVPCMSVTATAFMFRCLIEIFNAFLHLYVTNHRNSCIQFFTADGDSILSATVRLLVEMVEHMHANNSERKLNCPSVMKSDTVTCTTICHKGMTADYTQNGVTICSEELLLWLVTYKCPYVAKHWRSRSNTWTWMLLLSQTYKAPCLHMHRQSIDMTELPWSWHLLVSRLEALTLCPKLKLWTIIITSHWHRSHWTPCQ